MIILLKACSTIELCRVPTLQNVKYRISFDPIPWVPPTTRLSDNIRPSNMSYRDAQTRLHCCVALSAAAVSLYSLL